MSSQRKFHRRAVFVLAVAASTALAQSAPRPATRQADSVKGLDALSDDALYSELAVRGQDKLLERAFAANNVPMDRQAGFRALPAMRELADAAHPPTGARRRQLIDAVAMGIGSALPSLKDPKTLMEYATVLIREGVQPDVNTLEYWGDNPAVRKRLKPVVETALRMLDQAADEAKQRREAVEKRLNDGTTQSEVEQWTAADNLYNTAAYTRHMIDYNLALATAPDANDGKAERKKIAQAATEFLKTYDNEESGIQAAVRLRMAKLAMAATDFKRSGEMFQAVAAGKTKPPPTPVEQYEARYFGLLSNLGQGDVAAVRKGLPELVEWQKKALPSDRQVQDGVAAAAEMLKYRSALLERSQANNDQAKQAADAAAMKILLGLYDSRPDLRGVINDQLVTQVSADADVKKLDPLLLNALVQKGVQEREADKVDAAVLNKSLEAARELLGRKNAQITPKMMESATLAIPAVLEKLGETDPLRKAEAAAAYLDYVEKNKASPAYRKTVDAALQQAGYLLLPMMRDPKWRADDAVLATYERFLPIAVGEPFNHLELAFDYAQRLQAQGKLREAIGYFDRVPAADKRAAAAQYFKMVAMTDLLFDRTDDGKLKVEGPERATLLNDSLALIEKIKAGARQTLTAAPNDRTARLHLAGAVLTAAQVIAFEKPADWPTKLSKSLDDLETAAKGMPDADAMMNRGLQLRVVADMERKEFAKATASLIQLLEKTGGAKGADFVRGLILQLQTEYDAAEDQGDKPRMRAVAGDISELSKFLVQWAANNKSADIRKFTYRYKLFSADAERRAAALLEDPAAREQRLNQVMRQYQDLLSNENAALYRASLTDAKADPSQPDPNVAFGTALTTFDLGDWKTANASLRQLKADGKLGGPKNREADPKTGEVKYVDNAQYWEGTYKLLKSAQSWAAQSPSDADAQKELTASKLRLKQEYVRNPRDVGGKAWHAEFEALRKELTPEFDPAVLLTEATTRPAR